MLVGFDFRGIRSTGHDVSRPYGAPASEGGRYNGAPAKGSKNRQAEVLGGTLYSPWR